MKQIPILYLFILSCAICFADVSRTPPEWDVRKMKDDEPELFGFRVSSKEAVVDYEKTGAIIVEPNVTFRVLLFGYNLDNAKYVSFTTSDVECRDQDAAFASEPEFTVDQIHMVEFLVALPAVNTTYYTCLGFLPNPKPRENVSTKSASNQTVPLDAVEWVHQGSVGFATLKTRPEIKTEIKTSAGTKERSIQFILILFCGLMRWVL